MPANDGVVLLDSVTQVTAAQHDRIVVTGSHGGASAAQYAVAVRARLYVFNDAGVGKDGAGVAALAMLEAIGQPAATVAHTSARIGDAADAYGSGVLSHVNRSARALGLTEGQPLRVALAALSGGRER